MLKAVLTNEKCSDCRNCCVFFSKSRWEMPAVPKENAEKIREILNNDNAVEQNGDAYKMKSVLRENISEFSEEYRCSALDECCGCSLPPELKPVECSMWPLRIMNDDGKLYVTLASGCHAVDEKFTEDIKKLLDDGLLKKIINILKYDKRLIRDFEPSYIKLIEITEEILADEQ